MPKKSSKKKLSSPSKKHSKTSMRLNNVVSNKAQGFIDYIIKERQGNYANLRSEYDCITNVKNPDHPGEAIRKEIDREVNRLMVILEDPINFLSSEHDFSQFYYYLEGIVLKHYINVDDCVS